MFDELAIRTKQLTFLIFKALHLDNPCDSLLQTDKQEEEGHLEMHRQLYAQCHIDLDLTAISSLLVQGEKSKGEFYRAIDPTDGQEKYCIPATSLKGVWRNGSEQILRSFGSSLACDPFGELKSDSPACSKRFEKDPRTNSSEIYAALCPVCRLFGCTVHAGQLRIPDAWCQSANVSVQRTRIAIDRVTGNVAMRKSDGQQGKSHGATFNIVPLLPGSVFQLRNLIIDNFALWHLGLLALVFRDMNEGRVRVGKGTRQGMGHANLAITKIVIQYPRSQYEHAVAQGSTGIPSALALASKGVHHWDGPLDKWILGNTAQAIPSTNNWRQNLWTTFQFEGDEVEPILLACVEEALAPRLRLGDTGFFLNQAIAEGTKENG